MSFKKVQDFVDSVPDPRNSMTQAYKDGAIKAAFMMGSHVWNSEPYTGTIEGLSEAYFEGMRDALNKYFEEDGV